MKSSLTSDQIQAWIVLESYTSVSVPFTLSLALQRPTFHTHEYEAWSVTQPPMYYTMNAMPQTPVMLSAMYCSTHFRVIDTCVSKPKQSSLPVVLLPKKGANKYSQNVYSLSVSLQHSHLQFWIRSPDHTDSSIGSALA